MASLRPSSVPAITPDSLYITPGYPIRQQQKIALSRSSGAGIFGTVFLATTVFILSLTAEIVFQQAVKDRPCEPQQRNTRFKGQCLVHNCSGYGTPSALIGTSLVLTLILSIIATVYGACPCCCFRHIYAKNINFALSILFLVLLWITFVVTLFFGFSDLVALTITDESLCIKLGKGQLVSVAILGALLGFFGSAHIASANASRSTGPSSSDIPIGVPIGIPF